jgi:hypothetical protein
MGRAYFEAGNPEKAEELLASAVKLNPAFKEGKVFYDYLSRLNAPAPPSAEKKAEGFFGKWFQKKS